VIAAANNLTPPFTILPGQELRIPLTLVPADGCIAFLSTRAAGRYDLWARTPSRVGSSRLTFSLGGPASIPVWAPDGQSLAFVGEAGTLFVWDATTRQVRSLLSQLPGFTMFNWSPDSQALILSLNEQIILIEALTGATRPITTGDSPAFLPDGQSIVFTRPTGEFVEQVFTINLDGTGLRQVTNLPEAGNISDLSVDPRGELIAFTSPGASVSIVYIAELATGRIRMTPAGPLGRDLFPVWSPDGESLAYNSTIFTPDQNFQGMIRVVNRQGQLVNDLTDVACLGERLAWSPNSQWIAFPNCLFGLAQLTVVAPSRLPVQITSHGINIHPSWRLANCPTP
jgi:TolB protein